MNPRLRTILVFVLAILSFIAPLKFGLPVILYFLDTPVTNWLEGLICGWPTVVFYVMLVPLAIMGLGAGSWNRMEKWLLLWPGLFLVVQVLALWGSVNPVVSPYAVWLFVALAAGYLLGARTIRTARDRRWISWAWLLAALLIAWSGISQATGGLQETREFLQMYHPEVEHARPEYWRKVQSDRIFATFTGPNAFGGYIAAAVFMVAAWSANAWRSGPSPKTGPRAAKPDSLSSTTVDPSMAGNLVLSGAVILALLFCLWKTQSKGSYAVLVVSLVAGALLLIPRRRVALLVVAAIGLLAVGGFAAGYGRVAIERGKRTLEARVGYWRAAWQIGCDHPILGTGPGTFSRMYMRYKRPSDEDTKLVHNNYLQMWCDSGGLGFVTFALWLPGSILLWLRRWWSAPPSERLAPTLWWCACLAFALHSLVDFDLYMIGNSWPIFLLLGHLAAMRPEGAHSARTG